MSYTYKCIGKWLPPNEKERLLFQQIDDILCYGEQKFDENVLKENIIKYPLPLILRSTDGFTSSINWYSKKQWEGLNVTWENNTVELASNIFNNTTSDTLYELLKDFYKEDFSYENFRVWEYIYEEYKGTSTIQKFITKLVPQYDLQLIEWYENDYPVDTYSFLVKGNLESGWNFYENLKNFIRISKFLKNIESDFFAIQNRLDFCYAITEKSKHDGCFWDSPEGLKIEGVLLLFLDTYGENVDDGKNIQVDEIYSNIRQKTFNVFRPYFYRWDRNVNDETIEKWIYQQITMSQLGKNVQPFVRLENKDLLNTFWLYYDTTETNWDDTTWNDDTNFLGIINYDDLPYDEIHNIHLDDYRPYGNEFSYDVKVETHVNFIKEKIYDKLPYYKKMKLSIIKSDSYKNARVFTKEDYIYSVADEEQFDLAWLDSPDDSKFIST